MKKIGVFLCFCLGFLCVGIAIVLPHLMPSQQVNTVEEPKRLSSINIENYVSLPIIKGLHIELPEIHEKIDIEEATEKVMSILLKTAEKSDIVTGDCSVLCDYWIIRNEEELESKKNEMLGMSDTPAELASALLDCEKGDIITVFVEQFKDYEDVDIKVSINEIYKMSYPITDTYIKDYTEYSSYNEMIKSLGVNEGGSEINSVELMQDQLLEDALNQTTFIDFPESLCKEEYDILKKDDENIQYSDAKNNLRKIFFIAAVNSRFHIVDKVEIESRASKYIEENKINPSDYERERLEYLLCEPDVKNFIYKNADISTVSDSDEESLEEDGSVSGENDGIHSQEESESEFDGEGSTKAETEVDSLQQ